MRVISQQVEKMFPLIISGTIKNHASKAVLFYPSKYTCGWIECLIFFALGPRETETAMHHSIIHHHTATLRAKYGCPWADRFSQTGTVEPRHYYKVRGFTLAGLIQANVSLCLDWGPATAMQISQAILRGRKFDPTFHTAACPHCFDAMLPTLVRKAMQIWGPKLSAPLGFKQSKDNLLAC